MQRQCMQIIWIIAGIFCFFPAISFSCSCAVGGPASEDAVIEALCAVDVVFIGRATMSRTRQNSPTEVEIKPIQVFKGVITKPVVTDVRTNCDQWFSHDVDYLIFENLEKDSNKLSTSICGPSRFTSPMTSAEIQYHLVEENVGRIDELCSESVSTERRLRMLKERRRLTDIKYDQLLEDTRAILEENQ